MASSRPDALSAALRLLSARARTQKQLTALLERKGFAPAEVSAAIARVTELGYLDDGSLARARALALLKGGKLATSAVTQRLTAQGIAPATARAAVKEAESELGFDPLEAARALLAKKGLSKPADDRARAKAMRLLAARGFSEEVVEALLGGFER